MYYGNKAQGSRYVYFDIVGGLLDDIEDGGNTSSASRAFILAVERYFCEEKSFLKRNEVILFKSLVPVAVVPTMKVAKKMAKIFDMMRRIIIWIFN